MENKIFQHLVIKEFIKDTPLTLDDSPELRAIAVISYFALIGGGASEYNLLHLFKYAGLNLDDESHQDAIKRMLSYYCGARIIRIIDNGLGIKEMIEDTNSPYYMNGKKADVSDLLEKLNAHKVTIRLSSLDDGDCDGV